MNHLLTVTVGKLPISIGCGSDAFAAMVRTRYGAFAAAPQAASRVPIHLEVELIDTPAIPANDDLEVSFSGGCWRMRRGDFVARWNPCSGCGWVRQTAYPYAFDSVLRIIHSLVLAQSGGFLLHSASAIRGGRAFLFTGVSGAGKTTIARLAPPDAVLLSDEISYLRRIDGAFRAFGTPFAGELGIAGADIDAPAAALYFLRKGTSNEIAPVNPVRAAARLLRNVLFFAHDRALAGELLETVCDFAARVPLYELTFVPDAQVWELVR